MGVQKFIVVLLICGVSATPLEQANNQLEENSPSNSSVICNDSSLSDVKTEEDLYERLLPRVISPQDDDTKLAIKRMFMQYLIHSRTFLDIIRCSNSNAKQARLLQEDEDGDDGDDGGGGGGGAAGGGAGAGIAGGALDNTNVLNGVRRILANVFTGNLIGVIQEGVALRGPEPVTNVFTDVLSTLFGSAATAGITGVLGNLTTTAAPQPENATLSYQEQQYLIAHQQQLLLAQQQGQLGGAGSIPGQGYPGVQGQRLPGQYPGTGGLNQQYPQFQQQQQAFPNQVLQKQLVGGGVQTQQGIKRRPGQQQQLFQQQSQQIPVQPQPQIPQQPQPVYPQHQQLAGGLQRQHNQQVGGASQTQQFGGVLQGQQLAAQPSQIAGGLQRQPAYQINRRKPAVTQAPQEDYDEDKEDEEEE